MLHERPPLLLLSQSGFKLLLSESLTDKLHCTYVNFLQHVIFARFLLIENYGKCALRKEPVIGQDLKQVFFKSLTDKFH